METDLAAGARGPPLPSRTTRNLQVELKRYLEACHGALSPTPLPPHSPTPVPPSILRFPLGDFAATPYSPHVRVIASREKLLNPK